jgi:HK97 family phage portal protein
MVWREAHLMAGLFGALVKGAEYKVSDIEALTWTALLGQPSSKAGVSVNIDTALRVSTVLACARVLAEGVASLPLKVLRQVGSSKQPADDLSIYKLLFRRPNEWQTSFELREMMMFHAVMTGNAYAYIGRGNGEIQEIIPLIPNRVRCIQHIDYGIVYTITDLEGGVTTLPRESVMHLRGPSWNGYLGMDAVHLAREAIGLAIATEETQSRLFANSARPGGVLSIKGELSKESRERLKARLSEQQEGLHNSFKTLVLDQEASWSSMSMTGVDAQQLETRRFQIEEVCRGMRVFPQMVMHSDKTSTFASADAFFLAHVIHSLMPWITRWEQTIERDLLADQDDLIAKHNVNGLLRGDAASRGDFYLKALGGARAETAYMTRNEVRELEDMDPIEGGDTLPVPLAPIPETPAPIGGPDLGPAVPAKLDATKPASSGGLN